VIVGEENQHGMRVGQLGISDFIGFVFLFNFIKPRAAIQFAFHSKRVGARKIKAACSCDASVTTARCF